MVYNNNNNNNNNKNTAKLNITCFMIYWGSFICCWCVFLCVCGVFCVFFEWGYSCDVVLVYVIDCLNFPRIR